MFIVIQGMFIKGASAVKIVGAAMTGLASFVVANEWTHNIALAVVCQSFATLGAAYLMNRHKFTAVKSAHELSLIDRLHIEREGSLKILMGRLEQQNKLIAALTITKHAFAGDREAAYRHLELRGELLEDAGIAFPAFTGRSFRRITVEEDRLRAEIMGLHGEAAAALIDDPRES